MRRFERHTSQQSSPRPPPDAQQSLHIIQHHMPCHKYTHLPTSCIWYTLCISTFSVHLFLRRTHNIAFLILRASSSSQASPASHHQCSTFDAVTFTSLGQQNNFLHRTKNRVRLLPRQLLQLTASFVIREAVYEKILKAGIALSSWTVCRQSQPACESLHHAHLAHWIGASL